MAEKVILSPKYSLQLRDFLKGALVAVISAVFPIVQSTLDAGTLTFNWKTIGITAVSAFLAYIVKNWFIEPAKVVTLYNKNSEAERIASEISKKV